MLTTNRPSGQPAKTTTDDTRKKGKRWSTRKRVRPLNKMERDSMLRVEQRLWSTKRRRLLDLPLLKAMPSVEQLRSQQMLHKKETISGNMMTTMVIRTMERMVIFRMATIMKWVVMMTMVVTTTRKERTTKKLLKPIIKSSKMRMSSFGKQTLLSKFSARRKRDFIECNRRS